jgi:hypothetical protein
LNDRRIVVLVGSKRFNRNWPDNQTCSTKFTFILSDTIAAQDGSSTVSRICSPPNDEGPTPAISVLRKLEVILLEPLALPADVHGLCLMKLIGSRNTSAKHCRDLESTMSEDDVAGVERLRWSCSRVGDRKRTGVMPNLTAVASNIAQGSIAAYYPEANVLVALDHYDAKSGTPSYKSTPVLLQVRENHEVLRRLVETAND